MRNSPFLWKARLLAYREYPDPTYHFAVELCLGSENNRKGEPSSLIPFLLQNPECSICPLLLVPEVRRDGDGRSDVRLPRGEGKPEETGASERHSRI